MLAHYFFINMPSITYSATLTGLSTTTGPLLYFPDTTVTPFSLFITAWSCSAQSFSVQHSQDYPGPNSSAFTSGGGWISSNATWFNSSGMTAVSSQSGMTSYNYPVAAIRLLSTDGSSTGWIYFNVTQAG